MVKITNFILDGSNEEASRRLDELIKELEEEQNKKNLEKQNKKT